MSVSLSLKVRGSAMRILPQEYNIEKMYRAFYVMAKVTEVRKIWCQAGDNYPLFEENIREYLGTGGINRGIIDTLKDKKERYNFFYYNNGITIICDDARATSTKVYIKNPQIVNGCQTVNSIVEALKAVENVEEYTDVYVMVKILVDDKRNNKFYKDVVKYTNSQNAINYKVFGAARDPFFKIQDNLKQKGILLLVKQSDKHIFKEKYKDKKNSSNFLKVANENSIGDFFKFDKITDCQIQLETLLQIIGAFVKDAHFAYTKKSALLKPTSRTYTDFSTTVVEEFTANNMLKLILLYKKAEADKKQSADKKTSSIYYFLNFIGRYLNNKNIKEVKFLQKLDFNDMPFLYKKFKILSTKYYKEYKQKTEYEYNQMIKQKVDEQIMDEVLNNHLQAMREYQEPAEYDRFINIFDKIKNTNN